MITNENYRETTTDFRERAEGGKHQSFALEVIPGHVCQLNCQCCYKRNGVDDCRTNGAMPTEDAKSYIDQATAEGFKEIVLIGGEPALHKDIYDLIRYIRHEKSLSPILVTNAISLADAQVAEELAGTKSTVVTHGYFPGGEDVIDEFSGKRGYAEVLKRALENLKKIPDTQVVMEMPLTDLMFKHAFEFFKHCREQEVLPFIEISRRSDGGKPTTTVTPEQVAQLFNEFREYDEKNYPHLADKNITPPAYGNKCTMSITSLHVKNFGRGDYGGVYSCCAQKVKHGDLKEQPLKEILKSRTLEVFADQDKYIVGPCRDCDMYPVCKGGCRGEAFLKFGCPRASSPTCHLIPKEVRENKSLMAPKSCEGCPAQDCAECSLKNSLTQKS